MGKIDDELKAFFDDAFSDAPEDADFGFNSSEQVAEGEWVLVREVAEDENDVYIQILASGNLEGIVWLYERAKTHLAGFKGGITEAKNLYDHGEKVEFH